MISIPQYPKKSFLGSGSGSYDIENIPLTEQYRSYIPKSTRMIHIGQEEELPHGRLRCFVRQHTVVVGVYDKHSKPLGYELLYQPERSVDISPGAEFPEWVFDMQNKNFFGTDWDFQSNAMLLWTVAGLRANGGPEKVINLDE